MCIFSSWSLFFIIKDSKLRRLTDKFKKAILFVKKTDKLFLKL